MECSKANLETMLTNRVHRIQKLDLSTSNPEVAVGLIEAIRQRESISNSLSRERKLRQANIQLKEAEAIDILISCNSTDLADDCLAPKVLVNPIIPSADLPDDCLAPKVLVNPIIPSADLPDDCLAQNVPVNPSFNSTEDHFVFQPKPEIQGRDTPKVRIEQTTCDIADPIVPPLPVTPSTVKLTAINAPRASSTPACASSLASPVTFTAPEPAHLPSPFPATPNTVPSILTTSLTDMLVASQGVPKPSMPKFVEGTPREFALLKMGLDNLMNVYPHLTEQYKYQVLLDHLKHKKSLKLANSFMYAVKPYSDAMTALNERYGQPRQLVQTELGKRMNISFIRHSDFEAFDDFCLDVASLVGMLKSIETTNGVELKCGSHVDRLLTKLPPSYRNSFVKHCLTKGILKSNARQCQTYTLVDLANWLKTESQTQAFANGAVAYYGGHEVPKQGRADRGTARKKKNPTAVFVTAPQKPNHNYPSSTAKWRTPDKPKPNCPYCNKEHYLNSCPGIKQLSEEEVVTWMNNNKRCYKCCRAHKPEECTLKKPCHTCNELHLTILHNIVPKMATRVYTCQPLSQAVYIHKPTQPQNVMLKVVPVYIDGPADRIETFALLDDGSERTMVLWDVVEQLQLRGMKETIHLKTVRDDIVECNGLNVSFQVSPRDSPDAKYDICGAFASRNLCLSEYTYPVKNLRERYPHLSNLPLPLIDKACPVILIGSDQADLIIPRQAHAGPRGAPIAVLTELGWTLQGPSESCNQINNKQRCYTTSTLSETTDIMQDVQRLWQVDVLPYINEKQATRSRQNKQAIQLLETKTMRVDDNGTQRYATPLLRKQDSNQFHAPAESVLPTLKRTERRLEKNPELASKHNELIINLVDSGYVKKLSREEAAKSTESWYFPHHVVEHNGKHRLVFNCSFSYHGQVLNQNLMPGPSLGASLLGVLLRFRQHKVAISGDIKAMFHQVMLLPDDKPLLRFIWRNLDTAQEPDVYEWQVLPFGTTCSPCCATFALQKHAFDHKETNPKVADSVENSFYVDNCLDSVPQTSEAKALVHDMRELLKDGGFEIRQWASNDATVVENLPPEAKSEVYDLWLTSNGTEPREATLGLRWECSTDELSYRHKEINYNCLNMRTIYKILASQYDPLGYLTPFTVRAKIIVQDLWNTKRHWDEPLETGDIQDRWHEWERELPDLQQLKLPRCYNPGTVNPTMTNHQLHVFCDASERAYGSVAYLRTEEHQQNVNVSFIMARSRVAPKKQLSMPRLELSAALTGAQLASLLQREMSLPINRVILWSDSTTVLSWLMSETCQFKVFVGTRVTEIQTLTDTNNWRYVDTKNNPADDLTRGKTLAELSHSSKWRNGPKFLSNHPDQWPTIPCIKVLEDPAELKKATFVGSISTGPIGLPDPKLYNTWEDLMNACYLAVHGAAADNHKPNQTAEQRNETEFLLYRIAQRESFPEDYVALKHNRNLPPNSRLLQLSPEFDGSCEIIKVGGRLRRNQDLPNDAKHPIVLDPSHPITKLLIRSYDENLKHYGSKRILAEIRRKFWILRGREAIRKHQHQCHESRKWRAKPELPKMSDLPTARLRLFKPAFYSTGVDCFGPMHIKVGRRTEKRWGIIFKCMTTRAVHLDLLQRMDTDGFLMSFRRFIARRGRPYELLSDCGTNFKGGDRELREAFLAMEPSLQQELAKYQVRFRFNPPLSPHFGGTWEREIKSVKSGLKTILNDQIVSEPVLNTVMLEVEGILNSKPLGYVSSDIADIDPITPNVLLMGRRDASLPQVVYPADEMLGRRQWRHSQVLADQFWSYFIKHYLPTLQLRPKWHRETEPLSKDDIVMVVEPSLARSQWPVGKVTEVLPGADGRVRVVNVKIKDRTYVRSSARLIRLPELKD